MTVDYALRKSEGKWYVFREGELLVSVPGQERKWEARIELLKAADARREIAAIQGEQNR